MSIKDGILFLKEVKLELSKVLWPKWDEFVGSTLVVLFLVLVFAVYLGAVDFAFSLAAKYIFKSLANW